MSPGIALAIVVMALAGAYLGIWAEAHWSGRSRQARAARNGLVAHLAFSVVFFVVIGGPL